MVTDRVYATLQAGYRIGCTSIERIRKEVMFLNNHRNDDRATYLSTIERLRSLRSGFLPTSAILYDWELDPDTYLSDREKELLRPYINTGYEKVTRNKLLFQQLVAPRFEDQLPTVYGVVTSDRVLSTDGSVITESAAIWLETTVRENNVVVCKPAHSSGGTGVVIFRSNSGTLTANGDTTGASEAVQLLSERAPYLVTEYVEQHSYSESIYSDAVNTLRILVYRNPRTCETFIPQAIHRFGTDASAPVDNWDKGGLSAQIDLETGELGKAALPPNSDTVTGHQHIQIQGPKLKVSKSRCGMTCWTPQWRCQILYHITTFLRGI